MQLLNLTEPFQVVGIDILKPLPRTGRGNMYLVVVMDRFTRWPELKAVGDITAETLCGCVCGEGHLGAWMPSAGLVWSGSQFTSQFFRRIAMSLGIANLYTTAYHPQTNGQV